MRANRDLRERQYAERRVQDQEHALRRERELHHSLRAQYRAQTAAELAALGDVQRARQAKRAADNRQVRYAARGCVWREGRLDQGPVLRTRCMAAVD